MSAHSHPDDDFVEYPGPDGNYPGPGDLPPKTIPAFEILRQITEHRTKAAEERRRRGIIRLDERDIHQFLGLPEGMQVVGVNADFSRFSIDIMVQSDELGVVGWGAEPPVLSGTATRSEVYVPDPDDEDAPATPYYRMEWTAE